MAPRATGRSRPDSYAPSKYQMAGVPSKRASSRSALGQELLALSLTHEPPREVWDPSDRSFEQGCDRLRCGALHGLGDVRVPVQSDGHGGVAQHLARDLRVYSLAEKQGRRRMA